MAIVTFTTDFGQRDPFAAAMKGVVLGIAPDATLVDVTHEIEPFDVWGGAIAIAQAAPSFPAGTVHVVVVDPGVGSARAPIVVEDAGARFVGPDNGVLTLATRPDAPARRIADRALMRAEVSATFHGRDVFAPVAAHLARGVAPAQVGPPHVPVRLDWPERPEVVHADRFGNLLLSLRELPEDASAIEIEGLGRAPARVTFADVEPGKLVAYLGSFGFVEVAVREGSAADRLRLAAGRVRGARAEIVR